MLTSLAAGVISLTLLILPFGMTVFVSDPTARSCFGLPGADPVMSLIGKFCEASETYSGLTINAFSLWRNPFSGLGDTFFRGDDTVVALVVGGIGLTWQQVGTLLFGAVVLLALWQVARRDDMRGLLLASLLIAIAFFVLPTRVHERYLFPAVALAAPLLLSGRIWPWVYGGLSAVLFLNIYWAYTEDWSFSGRINNPGANGQPMPQDPFLTSTLLTDWGIWLIALLGVVLLAIVAWQSLRLSLTPATEPDRVATPRPEPARPPPHDRQPAAWAAAPAPVRSRFAWLSPNAADAYFREPWRRLDRRDALILLAIVAFALVFRLWRLDIPRSQHFDEVYHGRSATEWLSAWQEGWDRDVYEWTHPMLAKYLIAGGIVAADPNKVTGTASLAEPSSALAVAPRREASGWERSVAFTVEAPSTVVASDADTGEELAQLGGVWTDRQPRLRRGGAAAARRSSRRRHDRDLRAGRPARLTGRPRPTGRTADLDRARLGEPDPGRDTKRPTPSWLGVPTAVAVIERATDAVLATAEGTYGGLGLVHGVDDEPDAVAVTDAARGVVAFLDATTLEELGVVDPSAPLTGPLITRGSGDDQQIFALTGPLGSTDEHPVTGGGLAAIDADGQNTIGLVPLPGAGSLIGLQRVAGMVYVAGIGSRRHARGVGHRAARRITSRRHHRRRRLRHHPAARDAAGDGLRRRLHRPGRRPRRPAGQHSRPVR